MGIGRREFLKYVGIALAGTAIDPLQAVAINSDYYINRKFGFALSKPMGWDFVSVKDFGRLKADQALPDELESFKDEFLNDINDPVLVIAKYSMDDPRYDDKFSPAITIFITHKDEIRELYGIQNVSQNFEELVSEIDYYSKSLFKNYQETREIQPICVSKCNGYDSLYIWTFESIKNKKSWACNGWSILIEKGDYVYSFNMFDSDEANEVETDTFQKFLNTIKIL